MPVPGNKRVFILIGPKGSGKTYIGKLLEKKLKITFINVEALLIKYIEENDLTTDKLNRHGFDIEEQEIDRVLSEENSVIFDATGASIYLPSFLESLGTKYLVKYVKIFCPNEVCFKRVKARVSSEQFKVSDELVLEINNRAKDLVLNWDLIIDNTSFKSSDDITAEFLGIV